MIIPIGIPTLSCYDKLYRLCSYLDEDNSAPINISLHIIDNGAKLQESEYFEKLARLSVTVQMEVPPYNLGVAPSWNRLIQRLGPCIIANDDTVFSKYDIQLMIDAASASPESIMFAPANEGGGATVLLINKPKEWLSMGGFDEAFAPAYFEDDDAARRLALMDCPLQRVMLRDWRHDNSSTLHSSNEQYQRNHWCCFNRNHLYYQIKWGGLPGHEQFTTPFNCK